MNKKMAKVFVTCACFAMGLAFVGSAANAAPNGPVRRELRQQIRELNQRVTQLEQQNGQTNNRLNHIEDYLRMNPSQPTLPLVHACILVASTSMKTYLGLANTKLDARYNAQKACEAQNFSGYCQTANVRCDRQDRTVKKFVCLMTSKTTGKTFRGEGVTAVAAEANAKQDCQKTNYAGYCGLQPVQCEAIRY